MLGKIALSLCIYLWYFGIRISDLVYGQPVKHQDIVYRKEKRLEPYRLFQESNSGYFILTDERDLFKIEFLDNIMQDFKGMPLTVEAYPYGTDKAMKKLAPPKTEFWNWN